ncbi:glutamine synthetase beta-grasp domain-containing protein [Candidatus Micrarchaeota archaeon]|nr:glutamine synthetase beta-grasp domain-containing protein [Candidatus Micrarchaeota archaeon]
MPTPEEALEFINVNNTKWIDLQFIDISGRLNRTTVHAREFTADAFVNGVQCGNIQDSFGWSQDGELVLRPDPDTFGRVPWEANTVRFICDVVVAPKMERFLKDPRYVAERVTVNAKAMGLTEASISPEMEFYIFDAVSVDKMTPGRGPNYLIDAREAPWNPSPLWGAKNGAFIGQPYDSLYSARNQVSDVLEDNFRFFVQSHFHGRSPSSQQSITLKANPLRTSADATMTAKYVVRNLAFIANGTSTFMPMPIHTEKGSSLRLWTSLWKGDENIFYDPTDTYAQVSQNGRYFIGGLIEHAAALALFTAPTTNSYKKLLADPLYIAWSRRSNGSLIRVPFERRNEKTGKSVVFMGADPSVNPYLAYSVVIAAGLDGIKRKKDPGDPVDKDIPSMNTKERKEAGIDYLPSSLIEAISEFETDNAFLKGVLSSELLEDYLAQKMDEQKSHNLRTSAYEFEAYYNV